MPFGWLDRPENDPTFGTQQGRVSAVMETYFDRSLPKESRRIIDAVFEKHGLSEDGAVPEPSGGEVLSKIRARIAAHALGVPFEKPITEDELRAALGDRLSNPE